MVENLPAPAFASMSIRQDCAAVDQQSIEAVERLVQPADPSETVGRSVFAKIWAAFKLVPQAVAVGNCSRRLWWSACRIDSTQKALRHSFPLEQILSGA